MSPTLGDQQRVFVNKLAYLTAALQDGGAFMFRHPLGPSKSVVKRVIARSGDRVHIVDDRVSVNRTPLEESYVAPDARSTETHGPEREKEVHYFVMGDLEL